MEDYMSEPQTAILEAVVRPRAAPGRESRVDWSMRQFIDDQILARCRAGRPECGQARDCRHAQARMAARGVSPIVQARIIDSVRAQCGAPPTP